MRVYLDNCCFNRPFDDQRQTRVRLEAEAKLCIQEHIRSGTLELVWSYMVDFENAANPFEERRTTISGWRQYAAMDIEETAIILQHATLLAVGLSHLGRQALAGVGKAGRRGIEAEPQLNPSGRSVPQHGIRRIFRIY